MLYLNSIVHLFVLPQINGMLTNKVLPIIFFSTQKRKYATSVTKSTSLTVFNLIVQCERFHWVSFTDSSNATTIRRIWSFCGKRARERVKKKMDCNLVVNKYPFGSTHRKLYILFAQWLCVNLCLKLMVYFSFSFFLPEKAPILLLFLDEGLVLVMICSNNSK